MLQFREVKRGRVVQLARDMTAAAHAVRDARRRVGQERFERDFDDMRHQRMLNPEIEAGATKKLTEEEESIARKYDMCPGWSYDEFEMDYYPAWRERRRR